jgi:FlaA1/EpsC-like NDP-sugar epimerase
VTDPETKRFFMSIPEAVQLVLQASTLDESNVIFMLEMGEPIKIVDLARNLIELSGLKVDEDIEIVFTGMRPGEKIHEELLTADENLLKTPFDKIRMQRNENYDPDRIEKFIHDLKSNVELGNIKALYNDLEELIPEMTGPSFEELQKNMFG